MDEDKRATARAGFLQDLFLTREDVSRCFGSLSKLTRHVDEPVVLTGSLAAGWHVLKNGGRLKKKRLNDIDTVAVQGLSLINPSLSRDFLINHFHPQRERGKVLLQLVDEQHRTRLEIFTPAVDSLAERLTECAVGELSCRVVSAEDALAKLLAIVHSITQGRPVDPKFVEQFNLLSTVADKVVVKKVWRDYRKENQSLDFDEAAEACRSTIASHPELLQATCYLQDVDFICPWCHESELFPVAPRQKIREILGYV